MNAKDLFFLNLPDLPKTVDQKLYEICKSVKTDNDRLNSFRNSFNFNGDLTTIALQEYNTDQIKQIPKKILTELKDIYSPIFREEVHVSLGIARSIESTKSLTPPHCDRKRHVAINYILKSGGDNVVTTFYKEKRKNSDLNTGESLDYDQVSFSSCCVLPERKWHTFNAQQYHSVENIKTERYYFSLLPLSNPTFEKFIEQHKSLITKKLNCEISSVGRARPLQG